jgi:hypothetical protein
MIKSNFHGDGPPSARRNGYTESDYGTSSRPVRPQGNGRPENRVRRSIFAAYYAACFAARSIMLPSNKMMRRMRKWCADDRATRRRGLRSSRQAHSGGSVPQASGPVGTSD